MHTTLTIVVAANLGIIDMNKNENSANFSCMFVMTKKLKLFASTLNGIPICVRCVSSVIFVFNA